MDYDIIIIGGGAAGLAAAVYACRGGKKTLVIENAFGGQVAVTPTIENYLGFESISGYELAEKFLSQAKSSGAEFLKGEIKSVSLQNKVKEVTLEGKTLTALGVVIATGISNKKLGLEGETELIGSGVSYCATCDGNFFKKRDVAVFGGNGAINSAKYLSEICKNVFCISDSVFNAKAVENLKENITLLENTKITKLVGNPLSAIKVATNNQDKEISVSGLFVSCGVEPQTSLFKGQIELDEKGFILTNALMNTSLEGVTAAGDVVKKSLRQIVTAVSDGAVAATTLIRYISAIKI